MADRPKQFLEIPAGAKPRGICRGEDCGEPLWFVANPATGKLIPTTCDLPGETYPPTHDTPGCGVNHYQTCPNAGQFGKNARRRK